MELISSIQGGNLIKSIHNQACDWTCPIVKPSHRFNCSRWHDMQDPQSCLRFLFEA